MQYTTIKRFKRPGITGARLNIPYGTPVTLHADGMLYHDSTPVCLASSFAAHEHFARDDDGQGETRGKLSHAIISALGGFKCSRTPQWQAVWDDSTCAKYKKRGHDNYWLWDTSFFNAPVEDLRYIAALVNVKGVE